MSSSGGGGGPGGRYHATKPSSSSSVQTNLSFEIPIDDSSSNTTKLFGDDKRQLFDRLSFVGKPAALRDVLDVELMKGENCCIDEKTKSVIDAFLDGAKKDKASSVVIATGTRKGGDNNNNNNKENNAKAVVQEIAIGALPTHVSRHNDTSGAHGLQEIAKSTCSGIRWDQTPVVMSDARKRFWKFGDRVDESVSGVFDEK